MKRVPKGKFYEENPPSYEDGQGFACADGAGLSSGCGWSRWLLVRARLTSGLGKR